MSSDPNDPRPLTPNTFLKMPLRSDANLGEASRHVAKSFRGLQRRWETEYLGSLKSWRDNTRKADKIKVGDVVLCSEQEGMVLARVHQVHPSADGAIRKLNLRMTDGSYKLRDVKNLKRPEIESHDE